MLPEVPKDYGRTTLAQRLFDTHSDLRSNTSSNRHGYLRGSSSLFTRNSSSVQTYSEIFLGNGIQSLHQARHSRFIEILPDKLNRRLVIVRRQQNQVGRRDIKLPHKRAGDRACHRSRRTVAGPGLPDASSARVHPAEKRLHCQVAGKKRCAQYRRLQKLSACLFHTGNVHFLKYQLPW